MRKFVFLVAAVCLLLAPASQAGHRIHYSSDYQDHIWDDRDFRIDVDDGTIIIENRDRDRDILEITPEYELYLNGELIETTDQQKERVEEFYNKFFETVDYAKEIGREGVKIGVKGAKLGLKAVGRVFKMIFTSYEADDLERDMEFESDKLEKQAEELEKMADKIEDMVEDLEDIGYDLQKEIPELKKLDWF